MTWAEIIEADLAWVDGRFERGVRIAIGADGSIAQVWRQGASDRESIARSDFHAGLARAGAVPHREWRGRALLPGFVNAHSHAFQRGLRGCGESFPAGAGDFFSWREAMYALVERLTPESAYDLSRDAFEEMLDGGYTSVGEFHYVRHLGPEARFALDDAVIHAAIDAGIRLVLLHTAYEAGSIGESLKGGQRRFETRGIDEYWREHDRLATALGAHRDASLGVVAHSVRAVPWSTIVALRKGARARGQVFHMHVEEVIREIEVCEAAHGRRPMRLVVDELEPDHTFTAVHCTHTAAEDMQRFAASGATVCLCPSTEGNLGDGIADVPLMRRAGATVAIGTDLNSRLCPFEELRWLEYVQRVARRQRGVVVDEHGESGPALMQVGTRHGAKSLGIQAGSIEPGAWADFCLVDLEHPSIADRASDPGSLAAALIFGAGVEAVSGTCVSGRWRMRRGGRPRAA
ncbi:MAG: formimidoylglutamate deiminase [Phycisphaeraceae bacterium]|nr:formimidoylglutamate deiminase [Phycisphaeraceae bacterium]